MSTRKRLVIVAVAIVVAFGIWALVRIATNPPYDQVLVKVSAETNKSLPLMLDAETRWDAVVPGPGNRLTYQYTVVNRPRAELDTTRLIAILRPKLINNYKTMAQMKDLRDNNTELNYSYRDKNGEYVLSIAISPRDF